MILWLTRWLWEMGKLPGLDSNQETQNQNLVCCHYTTGQTRWAGNPTRVPSRSAPRTSSSAWVAPLMERRNKPVGPDRGPASDPGRESRVGRGTMTPRFGRVWSWTCPLPRQGVQPGEPDTAHPPGAQAAGSASFRAGSPGSPSLPAPKSQMLAPPWRRIHFVESGGPEAPGCRATAAPPQKTSKAARGGAALHSDQDSDDLTRGPRAGDAGRGSPGRPAPCPMPAAAG